MIRFSCIIQKSGILLWIHSTFFAGTDSWTTGILPWIGGIFRAEYSAVEYAKKYTDNSGNMSGTYNTYYNVYKSENLGDYANQQLYGYGWGADCTNYVSQCLYYGGLFESSNWKPVWVTQKIETTAWVRPDELFAYFTGNLRYDYESVTTTTLSKIKLGDIVFFSSSDSTSGIHHATFCSAEGDNPLFCAHSSWRKDEPYKNHMDGKGTYYVVHIPR